MDDRNNALLSADLPARYPEHDLLDYAPFARSLATSICQMTPPEGLVIGIHGPWGAGKSTLLNFVEAYLNKMPNDDRPLIVRFNPWWFTGREDLARRFFDELQAELTNKWGDVGQDIKRFITNLADLASDFPIQLVSGTARTVRKMTTQPVLTIPELKNTIDEKLMLLGRRILIVIDDIDRSTADEIRQMFGLIKAVANFYNVVYLVAFDRDIVAQALGGQGITGGEYLEKIVQVPLHLPMPDRAAIGRMFLARLTTIFGDIPDYLQDQNYFTDVFENGVKPFLKTPRDVSRLSNALMLTYPPIRNEVNPTDFLAIETIRIWYPAIYEIVRSKPNDYAGVSHPLTYSSLPHNAVNDARAADYDALIREVPEPEHAAIKTLLRQIFPKVDGAWRKVGYGYDREPEWNRNLRICSRARFDTYFRMAPPSGAIPELEMRALISRASDVASFAAELEAMAIPNEENASSKVRKFLEAFGDHALDLPPETAESSILALFMACESIMLADKSASGLQITNETLLSGIVERLLTQLSEPNRFAILQRSIENATKNVASITLASRVLSKIAYIQAKFGESGTTEEFRSFLTITPDHLTELHCLLHRKILSYAQSGQLLRSPYLPTVLEYWTGVGDQNEVRDWVSSVISDDNGLMVFLGHFSPYNYGFQGSTIGQYLDMSITFQRVERMLADRAKLLTGEEQEVLAKYKAAYEKGSASTNL